VHAIAADVEKAGFLTATPGWGFDVMPVLQFGPQTQALRAMELGGLEPPTSWVRSRRSPN
jgi:hypothetical protein